MADLNGLHSHASVLFTRDGGLHPPPEVLKSWPNPNHINPEERGWAAPIVLLVVLGITFLVYMARIWARLVVAKNAGLDDLLISIAMLPLLGLAISVVLAIRVYGFQWHVWDQNAHSVVSSREIAMSIELNYMISTTLIKISILCFYRRITGGLTNTFVYWVWGSIIFCVIYGIMFTFLIAFICSPITGFFHLYDVPWRLTHELTCYNEGAVIVACAAISTVQDLVICMLPIFLIWNLRIQRRQKVALCGIFGMGLTTCVCGIMRTYYATYIYYYTYDITWHAYHGWIWTVLEAELGVICASAPALKVFFRRYFSKNSTRIGYSGNDDPRTLAHISRMHGYGRVTPMHSTHSTTTSRIVASGSHDEDVPLDGIKISQGLDVHVELRDDQSQTSYASTKNLTAPPISNQPGRKGRNDWLEGCRTVCIALKPGSRSDSRSRSHDRNIKSGLSEV
ncbi:uncharacterized protein K460DRAFT_317563 [Cucurbitaria berberidis CBS 394.84]|uniref:Rhodopsin domain-containing protein n=1 Tax=Cucurbitaria berberidis CBS 394.84 TaxID=1168544 RepID=A0A9P4GF07_9PLEO|nr:uncharacterized protein K460DRAFT_317563 [Cucurbitaria berberidis CBS 394.84]KAF1844244.1 hypothetical protein K460DRAFT_317563 [Cucurbitaria berberidis CBS 394.84]